MKKAIAHLLSLVLILTLTSCNFPGNSAPDAGSATPSVTSESVAGGITPTATPEELPTGYIDLLEDKITSGEWSLEEGLVTMLKLFAGEIESSEVALGQGVEETEGTGILRVASHYLQTGTDQATRDEITRLLTIITPSQEALDRFSIPKAQASGQKQNIPVGAKKLAAPARQDLQDCARLWAEGFDFLETAHFPCFLFDKLIIGSNDYQVYYPLAWVEDTSRNLYYSATLEAIEDSVAKYSPFGSLIPIYFVFYPMDHSSSRALATTFSSSFDPDVEACPVVIYPDAMGTGMGYEGEVENFKQAIAHEIFHCFQLWNLGDQYYGPDLDSTWWIEGTAQYFSNRVYPSTNLEQVWANRFSENSTRKPLTNMSYENFAFFQFLGNRVRPEGVLNILRSMPITPGRDAQVAALAAVPGMEATFDEFVRTFLDGTLMDSDNSVILFANYFTDTYSFTEISSRIFSSQLPFVASRYRLIFPGEKAFALTSAPAGVGSSGARIIETTGGWAPIPASVGGCEELDYLLYTITTTPGAVRMESVTASLVTDAPCDECLLGRWEATNESIRTYMQSVAPTGGGVATIVDGVVGTLSMELDANGTGSVRYDDLVVHETGLGGIEGAETSVTFEGSISGPYQADGTALTGLAEATNIVVSVNVFMGGTLVGTSTVPFGPADFVIGGTIPTRYTCGVDTLFTWPPATGGATVEPIMYMRLHP